MEEESNLPEEMLDQRASTENDRLQKPECLAPWGQKQEPLPRRDYKAGSKRAEGASQNETLGPTQVSSGVTQKDTMLCMPTKTHLYICLTLDLNNL